MIVSAFTGELNMADAVELLQFWFDMEADKESERDEDDDDPEYKRVVRAALLVLKELRSTEHVAWCRYIENPERPTRITLCNSDDANAFKVYRAPKQQTPTLAQHIDGLRMVWVQEHRPYGMSECFSANTLIGSWQVYRPMRSTAILWQSACHKAEPCDSIDDGKAKCIADYKSRVRAIFNQGE